MRAPAVAVVLLLAPLAGCLGGDDGGPVDDAITAGAAAPSQDLDASSTDGAPSSNTTAPPPAAPRAASAPSPPAAVTPTAYDPGWPDIAAATVRPGARFSDGCTADFVFSSPDNRTLYVGTASHCVTGRSLGDRIPLADGAANGTLAYCSYGELDNSTQCTDHVGQTDPASLTATRGMEYWNDFALVRVDDADRAKVHPAMLVYGGPTGIATGAAVHDRVLTYGNSPVRPSQTEPAKPREGYVTAVTPWITEIQFLPASIPGDSGSPVLTADGRALGVMKYLGNTANNGAVNLDMALAYAAKNAGLVVELKTWALLDGGKLPELPA